MSFLLAIEGADGAGKHTAAQHVCAALFQRGVRATVISFPRYRSTVGGFALGEFLSGRMPVTVTPRAAAVLYGLDRMESVEFIEAAMATSDVIILDRYIASNMVYQASKVRSGEVSRLMRWIWALETETFGVKPPDLSIYLDTPLEHSRRLMMLKEQRTYTNRRLDEHEVDLALQDQVRFNYEMLAGDSQYGPWRIVRATHHGTLKTPKDISAEIVGALQPFLDSHARDSDHRKIA
jgi:dTMP kinase